MAYLQTTATSIDDIFNTIATFATGLGWTIDRNNTFTSGANTRRMLTISRAGADYAHFASELSTTKLTIHTMRSTGIASTSDLLSQTNRSTFSQTNMLSAGPYVNLWLFGESGSNPYIHCVVEIAAGKYRHFGIGELIKKGVWTGGSYCYGTFWSQSASVIESPTHSQHYTPFESNTSSASGNNGSLRCVEADSTAHGISGVLANYLPYDDSYSRRVASSNRGAGSFPYINYGMGIQNFAFSNYNQRSHLFHLAQFVTVAGGYYRYIGEPNGLRCVNIDPFQAAEEFTIASDTWKVFPIVKKGVTTSQESSSYFGFAYKKVV
jgi:hypothetical protein